MATRRTTEVDPIASVAPLNLLKTELFLCLRSKRSSSIAATGAGSSRREVRISSQRFNWQADPEVRLLAPSLPQPSVPTLYEVMLFTFLGEER